MPTRLYQLKISLSGTTPPIWRRVLVSEHTRLSTLHEIIQLVMGWENSHMHRFHASGEFFGPPRQGDRSEESRSLAHVAPEVRSRLRYTYDMGDRWEHLIVVEKIHPLTSMSPVVPTCVGGARACPPEDCGGVFGYEEMLEILADPTHPQHESTRKWAGPIVSEHFDLRLADHKLRKLRKIAAQVAAV